MDTFPKRKQLRELLIKVKWDEKEPAEAYAEILSLIRQEVSEAIKETPLFASGFAGNTIRISDLERKLKKKGLI